MLPYASSAGHVPFMDFRYYQNNHLDRTVSFGLGYRYGFSGSRFLGLNAYVDAIESRHQKHFRHGSVGLEWHAPKFNATANVYFPIGARQKTVASTEAAILQGSYLGIDRITQKEYLNRAVDWELGTSVWQSPYGSLSAYAGGYWQERQGQKNNSGGRLRAEWRMDKAHWLPKSMALSFGAYGAYDRAQRAQAGMHLKLNFGRNTTPQQPLFKKVERSLVFVPQILATHKFERARNYGKVAEFAYGNGEHVDVGELNKKIAALGANGLVLMSGSPRVDNSIILADGQTLLGGQGAVTVRTATGKALPFTYRAAPAQISASQKNSSVIKAGSNTVIDALALRGGLAGVGNLHASSANITLNNLDIRQTAGDGITLDGVDGIRVNRVSVRDLFICDNNTDCEYAVMKDPNRAPNAAFSAVGSKNITINDFRAQNVTYGIFAASKVNAAWDHYDAPTRNITITNASITNTRREGLLLVGVEDAKIKGYTINNSERVTNGLRDMDLIVLQGSSRIGLSNITLSGGVNGLMIVNSPNLPRYARNDITVKGLVTSNNSNSGVFINPAANVHLEDITVNDPATSGLFLYGSDHDFLGGAVKNVTLKNTHVNRPRQSTLTVWGPVQNLDGEITATDAGQLCKTTPWAQGRLEQQDGSIFKVNGAVIDGFSMCTP